MEQVIFSKRQVVGNIQSPLNFYNNMGFAK